MSVSLNLQKSALLPNDAARQRSKHIRSQAKELTEAGHKLVIAISSLPSLSKSTLNPIVSALIPHFPIAYAVFPFKNLRYTGGEITTILPFPFPFPSPPFLYIHGNTSCTVPYRPSGFIRCMSWNRFMGVWDTEDHQMAPEL